VHVKDKLSHAGLPIFAFCVGALLLTAATAQTDPSAEKRGVSKDMLVHRVPAVPVRAADYGPITPEDRLQWFARATVGPKSLLGGVFSAGFGTAIDHPHEYGTHWVGFGQRYGMRLTGVSTSNAIEAGLGSAWGEDPRYFHTVDQPFAARLKNIVDLTFRAYRSDGERHPAFARYIAIFGNNFASNSWRVPSDSNWQHAMVRSGEGFGARFISDTFNEFGSEVWRRVRHRHETIGAAP
jgi:hypothetical protein